jgi:hypothetical protein
LNFTINKSTIKSMDHRHQRIYTGVLAITALYTQYAAVVMSTPAVEIGDCWSANSVTTGGQITEDDLA